MSCRSAHMFSPTSKGSPGKSPKALPVNDGAAATGEAGTRSVSDSSGTVIQPGSPFSRHAAEAKADAVIDVSATPRCWTPGQMVADGKQPPANLSSGLGKLIAGRLIAGRLIAGRQDCEQHVLLSCHFDVLITHMLQLSVVSLTGYSCSLS